MPVHVLLVEDNEAQGQLLSAQLSRRQYEVKVITNGREVIRYLRTAPNPPDIVLLDIHLPEKNGIELSEYLKSNPKTRTIPLIAVSGTLVGRGVATALSAGFDAICPKPVKIKDLVEQMEQLLLLKS